MSRYVDADIATKLMIQWADRETNDDIRHGYHNCQVIMYDMPTADVVEVVRCKNCLFSSKRYGERDCQLHKRFVKDNDYCNYGEVRE